MEKKKIIKFIWGAIAVGLITFATIKSCKNNDFSAFKTLTSEKALPTRADRITAPKRANEITWNDINSWEDLSKYELKLVNSATSTSGQFYWGVANKNLPVFEINGVKKFSSSGSLVIANFNSTTYQLYDLVLADEPDGETSSYRVKNGDIFKVYDNFTSVFNKTLWQNTFEIVQPEILTATLELDLTNLTNFNLDKIYLDDNILPTNSNVIDLTTLTDGEHTLTFYDTENDNCFNSNIQLIYQGFGSLFEPLNTISIRNNAEYRGILKFNWNSSLLSENETYKIYFNGQASYNFNYLTNKSFVLNSTLNFDYDFFVEAEENIVYGTYSYNGNDYLALREYKSSSRGLFDYRENELFLNCEPQESTQATGVFIYSNGYFTPYGIYPRIISFNSEMNNTNITNFFVSTTGTEYQGDYMFTYNFIDVLLNNSELLTVEQLDTYQSGYNSGYQDGLKYATSLSNMLYNFFDGIDRALSIYVLPGIQIKYIVMIPLIFAIVKFVMSWLR